MRNNAPRWSAGGSIYPSRFVKVYTSTGWTAVQCGANEDPIGISGPGVIDTREDVGNAYHAQTGDYAGQLEVYGVGDGPVLLKAGTGGWTAGDRLKSDANGCGVVANGPGQNYGAYALEACSADEVGEVLFVKMGGYGDGPQAVVSADGEITAKKGVVVIAKTSAAALTIAAPTATTDDGNELTIYSVTLFAHTVTFTTSGFNSSGTDQDVATFTAFKGNSMTLRAYQGNWYVVGTKNVTLA